MMNDEIKMTPFSKLYFSKEINSHMPEWIWHYTGIDGLKGIVSSAEGDNRLLFWFTRSDCLNDTSEGMDVMRCLNAVNSRLKNDYLIDKSFFRILDSFELDTAQFISFPITNKYKTDEYDEDVITRADIAECEAFLCSFSADGDSLDMWRAYSNNDGYGLCLDTRMTFSEHEEYPYSDVIDTQLRFVKIDKLPVVYDLNTKLKEIENIVLNANNAYKKTLESEGSSKAELALKEYLRFELKRNQFRFKHECFSSEKEIRCVAYRPVKEPKNIENKLGALLNGLKNERLLMKTLIDENKASSQKN